MRATHCICHSISFAALLVECQSRGISTLEDLLDQLDAGKCCQLCHPYLAAMLETPKVESPDKVA